MDLDAAIRAKVSETHRLDDDCNMQCGASCAAQGYGDITRGVLAVLDLHKRTHFSDCAECREGGPGYESEAADWPCPTVLAIAAALEIEII